MTKKPSEKNKAWEKERRDRLNKSFDQLAKLLPQYDPSVTWSKIEIIQKSISHIEDIHKQRDDYLKSSEPGTLKEYTELVDSLKYYQTRNGQLAELLKKAKITIPVFKPPKFVTENPNFCQENDSSDISTKTIGRPGKYTNKLTNEEAEKLQEDASASDALSSDDSGNTKEAGNEEKKDQDEAVEEKTSDVAVDVAADANDLSKPAALISAGVLMPVTPIQTNIIPSQSIPLTPIKPTLPPLINLINLPCSQQIIKTPSNLRPCKIAKDKDGKIKILPHPQVKIYFRRADGKMPIPVLRKKIIPIKKKRRRKRKAKPIVSESKKIKIEKIEIIKEAEEKKVVEEKAEETEQAVELENVIKKESEESDVDKSDEIQSHFNTTLQIPQNESNPGSVSPTAAFLMSFPLVNTSTGKIVEGPEESSMLTPNNDRKESTVDNLENLNNFFTTKEYTKYCSENDQKVESNKVDMVPPELQAPTSNVTAKFDHINIFTEEKLLPSVSTNLSLDCQQLEKSANSIKPVEPAITQNISTLPNQNISTLPTQNISALPKTEVSTCPSTSIPVTTNSLPSFVSTSAKDDLKQSNNFIQTPSSHQITSKYPNTVTPSLTNFGQNNFKGFSQTHQPYLNISHSLRSTTPICTPLPLGYIPQPLPVVTNSENISNVGFNKPLFTPLTADNKTPATWESVSNPALSNRIYGNTNLLNKPITNSKTDFLPLTPYTTTSTTSTSKPKSNTISAPPPPCNAIMSSSATICYTTSSSTTVNSFNYTSNTLTTPRQKDVAKYSAASEKQVPVNISKAPPCKERFPTTISTATPVVSIKNECVMGQAISSVPSCFNYSLPTTNSLCSTLPNNILPQSTNANYSNNSSFTTSSNYYYPFQNQPVSNFSLSFSTTTCTTAQSQGIISYPPLKSELPWITPITTDYKSSFTFSLTPSTMTYPKNENHASSKISLPTCKPSTTFPTPVNLYETTQSYKSHTISNLTTSSSSTPSTSFTFSLTNPKSTNPTTVEAGKTAQTKSYQPDNFNKYQTNYQQSSFPSYNQAIKGKDCVNFSFALTKTTKTASVSQKPANSFSIDATLGNHSANCFQESNDRKPAIASCSLDQNKNPPPNRNKACNKNTRSESMAMQNPYFYEYEQKPAKTSHKNHVNWMTSNDIFTNTGDYAGQNITGYNNPAQVRSSLDPVYHSGVPEDNFPSWSPSKMFDSSHLIPPSTAPSYYCDMKYNDSSYSSSSAITPGNLELCKGDKNFKAPTSNHQSNFFSVSQLVQQETATTKPYDNYQRKIPATKAKESHKQSTYSAHFKQPVFPVQENFAAEVPKQAISNTYSAEALISKKEKHRNFTNSCNSDFYTPMDTTAVPCQSIDGTEQNFNSNYFYNYSTNQNYAQDTDYLGAYSTNNQYGKPITKPDKKILQNTAAAPPPPPPNFISYDSNYFPVPLAVNSPLIGSSHAPTDTYDGHHYGSPHTSNFQAANSWNPKAPTISSYHQQHYQGSSAVSQLNPEQGPNVAAQTGSGNLTNFNLSTICPEINDKVGSGAW